MAQPHLGQHLCIGLPGVEVTASARDLLQELQPGGIVLFARNIASADQLRSLIHAVRQQLVIPPLVAIDHENRRINRLRYIVGELPNLTDVIRENGARSFGFEAGTRLRALGIDLDFAPVLDLELFDDSTDNALRERCWGKAVAEVVHHAGEFIGGLQMAGVSACPKHFPGLGGAKQDSHEELPTIDRTAGQLWAADVAVFRELLPQIRCVMVGHGHYPAFDAHPCPATMSRAIVTGLLREKLGFTGLVITDDMEMRAIKDFREGVVGAFIAGADMLLVCHTPDKIRTAYQSLVAAVESGRLTTDRCTASRQRIERLKSV